VSYRRVVLQSPLAPADVARVLLDSFDPNPRWYARGEPGTELAPDACERPPGAYG